MTCTKHSSIVPNSTPTTSPTTTITMTPPSALRTRAPLPKSRKTVRFAADTKDVDTSDVSARKYRSPRKLSSLLFAPPVPAPPKPAPPHREFRPDYYDVIASRDRLSHASRSWMY
ncbi:hypothetical protein CC85DRAFT_285334 [Cutaneotrichosporon oleaginosum]|uniref:Uncharacterized protein n=1 Tax=Cutaneotrichosporon oleaginosum TaxID=879819 RepID=A0A0J0XNA1_9TREE|nr:uncharacterized protein CC85DRAFT_285334 [Cutaneotrichosporon oleaginosum]KLT42600.1 hypothetical protein CC85DRAFT_285334 [Cutaneotrichosporon oleaginosum]TXT05283.1 hypothetical protein COLE_06603 [Cutaneotrichosporon oleaginosum]